MVTGMASTSATGCHHVNAKSIVGCIDLNNGRCTAATSTTVLLFGAGARLTGFARTNLQDHAC
jgi:hypothetical protein